MGSACVEGIHKGAWALAYVYYFQQSYLAIGLLGLG